MFGVAFRRATLGLSSFADDFAKKKVTDVCNISYIPQAAAVGPGCTGLLTWQSMASAKQHEPEDFILLCAHKKGAPYR